MAWRLSPHCWQYAKPPGVEVAHRGHVIVLPDTGTITGRAGGGAMACGGGGNPCPGAVGPVPIGGSDGSADPQARQNFIPGGFSPRHTPQMTGNPALGAGVC